MEDVIIDIIKPMILNLEYRDAYSFIRSKNISERGARKLMYKCDLYRPMRNFCDSFGEYRSITYRIFSSLEYTYFNLNILRFPDGFVTLVNKYFPFSMEFSGDDVYSGLDFFDRLYNAYKDNVFDCLSQVFEQCLGYDINNAFFYYLKSRRIIDEYKKFSDSVKFILEKFTDKKIVNRLLSYEIGTIDAYFNSQLINKIIMRYE